MSDPQVTQVAFYANKIYGNFDRTAEPTLEGLAGVDSIGDAVADGGQAVNLLDTHLKENLKPTTSTVATIWRMDLALDSLIDFDALIIVHAIRYAYAEDILNNIELYHDTDATYNGSTELTPTKYFTGVLGEERSYLEFDGVDDKVVIADDADLDFGNGDGALEAIIYMPSVSANVVFASRYTDSNNRLYFQYNQGSDALEAFFRVGGTIMHQAKGTWTPSADTWYHVVWTFENGSTNAMYINGVALSLPTDTKTGGNMSLAVEMEFALYDTTFYQEDMKLFRQWNRYLTAAEVLTLYNGWTHTPIPVADQYGSTTEKITASKDRDFTGGATNWANVDIGDTFDETTDLTIKSTAADQYCQLPLTNFTDGFTVGEHYRLYYDYNERDAGWKFVLATDGADLEIGTAVEGTNQHFDFTIVRAAAASGLLIVATTDGSDGDFDNFSVVRTGCVAEYGPDGLNNADGKWYDKSPNNLDGTITGATYKNIIANDGSELDTTIIEFTEVEKQHIFFRINPDGLTGGGTCDVGQIGAAKKFTTPARPDFDIIKKDEYGIDGTETPGGRRSTNKRHDKRRRWRLSWSYINQSDKDSFEDFFDLIETAIPWSNYPFWFTLNNDADEPVFYFGRIIGIPEVRDLTYQAYAVSIVIETEI